MLKKTGILMLAIFMFSQTQAPAQIRDRDKAPVEQTWNLEDLYPSPQAWEEAKRELVAEFDSFEAFEGKLGKSPQNLRDCLQLSSKVEKELSRLQDYAHRAYDQDTRNAETLARKQAISQVATTFNTKTSFIVPEILLLDKKTIETFLQKEPQLAPYRFYLNDLLRRKPHILSKKEEAIIAKAGLMSDAAYSIYSVFSNAELPYPEIELSTGKKVLLDNSGFARHRAGPQRPDREKVFKSFFGTLSNFKQTLGTQLYANIKTNMFFSQVRNYDNTLTAALYPNNIPEEVYHTLVKNVNDNLDTFHRYLRLKQRMLGVEQLKYSDLYAPVVKNVDLEYTIPQAEEMITEALAPMGDAYLNALQKAFDNRWIDYHPTIGKRSGAYSSGSSYDVHPYILMNFNGKYNDVSTLAHELGHALHSYFSNKNQPYPLANYPIFVAEVASTLNEALLIQKQLEEINDDNIRLSLLMNYLDGMKGTLFRQTQFAEYELKIYRTAEEGTPLTGENLTRMYEELVKTYYGHDKGVCDVNESIKYEWSYIPHFYYNYYVYQYATSYTASVALAEKILNNETGIVDKYLKFISSGGSDYPIELLKEAGVDLTTSRPFEKSMDMMNRLIDEIESILDKT
ncbi:oligoendopeptidase F [candidate division KSB1 bacterium]|nr:oligoendopeptidase F [candidate division KSB1 bacterium]